MIWTRAWKGQWSKFKFDYLLLNVTEFRWKYYICKLAWQLIGTQERFQFLPSGFSRILWNLTESLLSNCLSKISKESRWTYRRYMRVCLLCFSSSIFKSTKKNLRNIKLVKFCKFCKCISLQQKSASDSCTLLS